jgi:hypothetical protein
MASGVLLITKIIAFITDPSIMYAGSGEIILYIIYSINIVMHFSAKLNKSLSCFLLCDQLYNMVMVQFI